MHRRYTFFIVLLLLSHSLHGQVISFKDTVDSYNVARLKINKTGMKVLGAWGIANIAEGGIGYFAARQDEWKYFHGMNALWGVVNTGISAFSLAGTRREMTQKLSYQQAYGRYRSNRKIYLINSGLDLVYIGAGIGLVKYSENTKNNPALFSGFGKSVVIQGAILLIFDNVMNTAHGRYSALWFRIMNEIRVSNTGIGVIHSF